VELAYLEIFVGIYEGTSHTDCILHRHTKQTQHRIHTSLFGTSQHRRWEVWKEPKKGLLF